MNNRPPAFQFYPDKWQSHTRRLSDKSYRIYHEILCWMWLQSQDYCSIPKSPESIACLLAMPCERIANALREIQNPHAPLFRVEKKEGEDGEKFVSHGLKKEFEKLQDRRMKAIASAKQRWKDDVRTQCERNANASFLQCSPTPTPIPTPFPNPNTDAEPNTENKKIPQKAESKFMKSEPAEIIIGDYCDILDWQNDAVHLALTLGQDEPGGPAEGFYRRALRVLTEEKFRQVLSDFWGICKSDPVDRPGAALTARLKQAMQKREAGKGGDRYSQTRGRQIQSGDKLKK